MSKVRNEAASVIAMQAFSTREHATAFDNIGERGTGDRMKRVAAELELAVELLRAYTGTVEDYKRITEDTDDTTVVVVYGSPRRGKTQYVGPVEPDEFVEFKIGDRVVPIDGAPRMTEPFTITKINGATGLGGNGRGWAVGTHDDGSPENGGIWLKYLQHAEPVEELAAWERELLSPFYVGAWAEVVSEGTIGFGHDVGIIGQVTDVLFDDKEDAIFVTALKVVDGEPRLVNLAQSPDSLALAEEPDLTPRPGAKIILNENGRSVFAGHLAHLPTVLTLREKLNWWQTVETAPGLSSINLNTDEFEVIG